MRAFYLSLVVSSVFLTSCAQRLDSVEDRLNDLDERSKILESRSGLPVGSDRDLLEGRRLADVRTQLAAVKNELTIMQGKVEALEFEAKTLNEKMRDLARKSSQQSSASSNLRREAASSGPENDYRQALAYHQRGDFKKSRHLFMKFAKENPRHNLTDNALYWVGHSYIAEGSYRKALVRFQDLVEKFPKSDKKCDSMARQVEAFRALGMNEEAKAYADIRTQECRKKK